MDIPTHIAIIPDGNRRWAKQHVLRAWQGHERGVRAFREIVSEAMNLGITHLTFWAASESNLISRPKDEVQHLVRLLREVLTEGDLEENLQKHQARLRFLGRWNEILDDPELSRAVSDIELRTSQFRARRLTIFFGYDGQVEMVRAVEKIVREHPRGVDFDTIKQALLTNDLPLVDLVIRTGEEHDHWAHLSAGFMMWDTANTRFYFPKVFWPDFSVDEFRRAIEEYGIETRRFGA